jgi:hypothetical protein
MRRLPAFPSFSGFCEVERPREDSMLRKANGFAYHSLESNAISNTRHSVVTSVKFLLWALSFSSQMVSEPKRSEGESNHPPSGTREGRDVCDPFLRTAEDPERVP